MTTQEITQYNKLIAEFMYPELINSNNLQELFLNCPEKYKTEYYLLVIIGSIIEGHEEEVNKLEFHTNWNKLIGVVKRIEDGGANVTIGKMFCDIDYEDLFDKTKHFDKRIVSGNKFNAVYGCLVEFIKWYNENK